MIETFVLRQANLTVMDQVLGDDFFEKVCMQRLNRHEKEYLRHLASAEEADLLAVRRDRMGSHAGMCRKIDRLLENAHHAALLLQE